MEKLSGALNLVRNTLKRRTLLLFFLVSLPVFGWTITGTRAQGTTTIYVDPAAVTANPGKTFTVNIRIGEVEGLWVYELKLKWEPDLLDVTSVTEGPFLNAGGFYKTFFVKKIWNEPDPMGVSGYLYVACTLMGEARSAAATGSGTLATVEFHVNKEGNSSLHLHDILLEDYDQQKLPYTTKDGYFQYPPPTQILVEPPTLIDPSLTPGETFDINVSITRAVEAISWSLNLSWDPTLLDVTRVEEGPFLNQEGAHGTTFNFKIHQEEGYLYANCSLTDYGVWASGDGTLFIVTFLVEAEGISTLDLHDTSLLNYEEEESFHTVKSGYFINVLRDVAIVGVAVSPERVRSGDSVSVSVVARNEGETNFGQSIDVSIYYNGSFLGTLGISDLNPGGEKAQSFSWNTKGLSKGKYAIKAVASQLSGEIDTSNNVYTYEYLAVTSSKQSFPSTLTITILVAAVLAAFAGFMILKKRS